MRVWPLLCCCILAGLSSGCSFFYYSAKNLIEEPIKALNHCEELREFRLLAHEAWQQVLDCEPGQHYSEDYACGFIDGYVDFLDADGLGEPPAVPPDRYQLARYHRTPEGVKAIEDWFAGFRRGAAAARASGQRELIVLPMGLPPRTTDDTGAARQGRTPTSGDGLLPEPAPVPRAVVPAKLSFAPATRADRRRGPIVRPDALTMQ